MAGPTLQKEPALLEEYLAPVMRAGPGTPERDDGDTNCLCNTPSTSLNFMNV